MTDTIIRAASSNDMSADIFIASMAGQIIGFAKVYLHHNESYPLRVANNNAHTVIPSAYSPKQASVSHPRYSNR
jgi:hypothetical protein